MHPILLHIGSFQLRTYGVVAVLAFLAALWTSVKEAPRHGLDPKLVHDFVPYALLGGIVGARLYYVVFSRPAYFLEHPIEIFAVWHGGIGVIGSLIGGFVAALWYCRRRGVSILTFGDVLAPGIALGQTLGQFACLANGDSYGRPTDLPWAIVYTDPRSFAPLHVPLHPIEIYEMLGYFAVYLIVRRMGRRAPAGRGLMTYLAAYGVARFAMEFFRGDPARLAWGIPAAQVFSAMLVAVSLAGFAILARRTARAV